MSDHRPPRLASFLISLLAPGEEREFILGDLREQYRRRSARSRPGAHLWYWNQMVRFLPHALWLREASQTANRRQNGLFQGVTQDLQQVIRRLASTPGFTVMATLILAAGICANTVVFSALRSTVLLSPPFPQPETLVVVDLMRMKEGEKVGESPYWSYPAFRALQRVRSRLIEPVVSYVPLRAVASGMGPAVEVNLEIVSPGYFSVLGKSMALGRHFLPDEADPEIPSRVVVLSHQLWIQWFSGSPNVLGRSLVLDGVQFEVVGVAPKGFKGLRGEAELWLPFSATTTIRPARVLNAQNDHALYVFGRLRVGASLAAAQAQMTVIGEEINRAFPSPSPDIEYVGGVRSFQEVWTNPGARTSALVLSAAAALVLLAGCANLAGLLLIRSSRRSKDAAVRLALGASSWRVIRESILEGLILAFLGGTLGVMGAIGGTQALVRSWPNQFLRATSGELAVVDPAGIRVDGVVLCYSLGVVFLSALVLGLIPGFRACRSNLSEVIRGARTLGGGKRTSGGTGLGTGLLSAEVSMAVVLLIGTGLMGTTVGRLLNLNLGFRPERLLTFTYELPPSPPEAGVAFHTALLQRISSLPGVEGVTLGCRPAQGWCAANAVLGVDGAPPFPSGEVKTIAVNSVSEGYLEVLGIPILKGRNIQASDVQAAQKVVMLSDMAARNAFGEEDPLGRRVRIGDEWAEVVGVVGDVMRRAPDQAQGGEAYFSFRQERAPGEILVRTSEESKALVSAIRHEVHSLNAQVAVSQVATMDEIIQAATRDRRLILLLLSSFTTFTVAFVVMGTSSLVAHSLTSRRQELAVRLALGESPVSLLAQESIRTLKITLAGLAVGLPLAWGGARLLQTFLYETDLWNSSTYLSGVSLMLGLVLLTSLLAARGALQMDPAAVLREEPR